MKSSYQIQLKLTSETLANRCRQILREEILREEYELGDGNTPVECNLVITDNLQCVEDWTIPADAEVWFLVMTDEAIPAAKLQQVICLPTNFSDQLLRSIVCLITKLSQQQHTIRELKQLAFEDLLTELPNRRAIEDAFPRFTNGLHEVGTSFGFALLDVDGLKSINDQWGYSVGDEVLKAMGRMLQTLIPSQGLAARVGGDEFVCLFPISKTKVKEQTFIDEMCAFVEQLNSFGKKANSYTRNIPAEVLPISVTAGFSVVAQVTSKGNRNLSFKETLEQADQMLRENKAIKKQS